MKRLSRNNYSLYVLLEQGKNKLPVNWNHCFPVSTGGLFGSICWKPKSREGRSMLCWSAQGWVACAHCCQHFSLAKSVERHQAPAQLLVCVCLYPAVLQKSWDERGDRNTAPVAMMRNPIEQPRQRVNWRVKLGVSRLTHPEGTQLLGWKHDVNSELWIHFLFLNRDTNEKTELLPLLSLRVRSRT